MVGCDERLGSAMTAATTPTDRVTLEIKGAKLNVSVMVKYIRVLCERAVFFLFPCYGAFVTQGTYILLYKYIITDKTAAAKMTVRFLVFTGAGQNLYRCFPPVLLTV